jgi:hypothetical protein
MKTLVLFSSSRGEQKEVNDWLIRIKYREREGELEHVERSTMTDRRRRR